MPDGSQQDVPPPARPVFTDINHICIVTHDLERLVRTWADEFGVRPWSVYRFDESDIAASVDGEPTRFGMRVALCHIGPEAHGRIEIIEPLDDRSPYAQSLAERGGRDHVHHVRLDVADYEAASEQIGARAAKLMEGRFSGADRSVSSSAIYFETADTLGMTVEISLLPPGFAMPEREFVYPEDAG